MKYARCAKCELNYVACEGDLCEYCARGDNYDQNEYCEVCGERYADGDDGLCSDCRREIAECGGEEFS